jgi:hypothetical protein
MQYGQSKKIDKVKKPKIIDGAPKGFVGNHHLWYIKQYKKWLDQKETSRKNLKHYLALSSIPIPFIIGLLGSKFVKNGNPTLGYILLGFALITAVSVVSLLGSWMDYRK